jgi:hypothetical protein
VTASPEPDGRWTLGLSGSSPRVDLPAFSEFSKKRGTVTDKYLVPGTAGELVQSGVLDIELFNITGLIRDGPSWFCPRWRSGASSTVIDGLPKIWP